MKTTEHEIRWLEIEQQNNPFFLRSIIEELRLENKKLKKELKELYYNMGIGFE